MAAFTPMKPKFGIVLGTVVGTAVYQALKHGNYMERVSGLLTLGFFAFVIWMFVDCVRNEEDKDSRTWWALALAFLPISIITAPLYYFLRHSKRQEVELPYMKH